MNATDQPSSPARVVPLWASWLGGLGGSILALWFGLLVFAATLEPFSGRDKPWIEESYSSPDGRYLVHSWGRSNFLDLEARVTIEVVGDPSTREQLLPWGNTLPMGVEWLSEREFRVDLGTRGQVVRPIHGEWRDVKFTMAP